MNMKLLQYYIAANGDTRASLAKKIGIHPSTMTHRMTGDPRCTNDNQWLVREAEKIRELYNLPMEDVIKIFF